MGIPVIKEPILYVDVDDTLVSWSEGSGPDVFAFTDPRGDSFRHLDIHFETIEQMALHRVRGHSIVVWSAGGAEWAHRVVQELKIEHLVDAVLAKPSFLLDDQPASNIIQDHKIRDVRKSR